MEKNEGWIKAGFSTILWAVMTILLCAAPCVWADETVPAGATKDIDYTISGNLMAYGTVKLLPPNPGVTTGAIIQGLVYTANTSVLNIEWGTVLGWIDVNPSAIVTVYGTGFNLPEGEHFIDFGTVTGFYENGDPIILTFDCQPGATVTLAPPGGPGPGPAEITIDIKPGSYPNAINLGSNGVIPVAILSTPDLDATTINPDTVFLAGSGVAVRGKGNKSLASQEDVNGDGLIDLVIKVETENLDPGQFQNGTAILQVIEEETVIYEGSDEITIVPPE